MVIAAQVMTGTQSVNNGGDKCSLFDLVRPPRIGYKVLMDIQQFLDQTLLVIGQHPVTMGQIFLAAAALAAGLILLTAIGQWRGSAQRSIAMLESEERARAAEERMGEILKTQSEMQGRMQTMAEIFGSRQSEMTQSIRERLDGMTSRIGQTMTDQTRATHENLAKLQERLAVIDSAQSNIRALAGEVVTLQSILSNKQTRGAFGQARMETIVADGLPMGAFEFQATLSNGNRPDCLILMPNGSPSLAIDAKFPLEAFNAIRAAETADETRLAEGQFRRDMEIHIKDISSKYLISGETQDTAFLFVPSESVFAEIHEKFEGVVQKAHRSRVVIVSPSLLMLSIQVIQSVLKDARMREQAHLIQGEVARLMEDVSRVDERVRKLAGHFAMAQKDVDEVLVSTGKVTKRGQRIEALEFGELPAAPEPAARVEAKSGNLRLRVVDGDE
jgi:DNA recombination protein RmuC